MAEIVCDGCGRTIVSSVARLCPACGFPTRAGAAPAPLGTPRKPEVEAPPPWRALEHLPGTEPVRVGPPAEGVLGPYCPACHHRGPAARIRCERCGAELWQGTASPRVPVTAQRAPEPAPPRPDRRWATPLLFTAAAVAAIAVVYALAFALASPR